MGHYRPDHIRYQAILCQTACIFADFYLHFTASAGCLVVLQKCIHGRPPTKQMPTQQQTASVERLVLLHECRHGMLPMGPQLSFNHCIVCFLLLICCVSTSCPQGPPAGLPRMCVGGVGRRVCPEGEGCPQIPHRKLIPRMLHQDWYVPKVNRYC